MSSDAASILSMSKDVNNKIKILMIIPVNPKQPPWQKYHDRPSQSQEDHPSQSPEGYR